MLIETTKQVMKKQKASYQQIFTRVWMALV